jgi:rare lipoprotein A
VMFNPATGKSVTGALFRRERDNPGPTLQISSDAAEALGILAGQPTEIKVTALRKEETEEPVEAAPTDALAADPAAANAATTEDPATEGAAPDADADAAATAALAAAALDAADAGATAATDTATEVVDGALPEAAPVEPPKKKTWKERRAEAKAKREAEKAAKAAAKAAAAAGTDVAPLDSVDPADSAVATIETAPLDARAPDAPAPETAPEAAPEAVVAKPAEAAPAPTGGVRPIQIASFSKEENAKRAVEALAKIGITAQPQKSGTATKAVWGVVASGDAALLAKIKDAGFADAYFLQ